MPHEDGAAYHPIVATVSLGAPIVLDLYRKLDRQGDVMEEQQQQQQQQQQHKTTGMMATTTTTTTKIRTEPQFRILQEPRSLLITTKKMYTDYLHGIAETERDEGLSANTICNWDLLGERERYECGWYERETRISLTYRDVLKVAKLGNSVKFLPGRR
ncbi:hypothetical protein VTN02DRAFT_1110 [Thermoascus thermophilus]